VPDGAASPRTLQCPDSSSRVKGRTLPRNRGISASPVTNVIRGACHRDVHALCAKTIPKALGEPKRCVGPVDGHSRLLALYGLYLTCLSEISLGCCVSTRIYKSQSCPSSGSCQKEEKIILHQYTIVMERELDGFPTLTLRETYAESSRLDQHRHSFRLETCLCYNINLLAAGACSATAWRRRACSVEE
jgi:hypothetical protein